METNGYYGGRDDYCQRRRRGDVMTLQGYNVLIGVLFLWSFVANIINLFIRILEIYGSSKRKSK